MARARRGRPFDDRHARRRSRHAATDRRAGSRTAAPTAGRRKPRRRLSPPYAGMGGQSREQESRMTPLLRRYLRPYRGQLTIVLVLLLVQAIGQLLLPSLNADIINYG